MLVGLFVVGLGLGFEVGAYSLDFAVFGFVC